MGQTIQIDPITRLEGHGHITVVLDEDGTFKNVYLQVPDFKGFEKFCEGRAVEEMPTLTQKICGVCPTAHHIAGVKALDDLFSVPVPPTAKAIRELMHHAFIYEDHLLHFYFLGGPDFLLGSFSTAADRNFFGIADRWGEDFAKKILGIRRRVREMHAVISGSPLYPVCALPGGVSKALTPDEVKRFEPIVKDAVEFARESLSLFHESVLPDASFKKLLEDAVFSSQTYYMGLVDDQYRLNLYNGRLRVIAPDGSDYSRFHVSDFASHLTERVDTYSFMKPLFLKTVGWKGLKDGRGSGIYRVGPLARLNVAEGISTPLAQAEYERMADYFGGWPVHQTFAYHWARLIEVMYAAEKMAALVSSPELLGTTIRNLPRDMKNTGSGVCEAPRGTLIHHYSARSDGTVQDLNLLVATQNNAAAIQLSLAQAARAQLKKGYLTKEAKNDLEMVFRAYDPCLACATH